MSKNVFLRAERELEARRAEAEALNERAERILAKDLRYIGLTAEKSAKISELWAALSSDDEKTAKGISEAVDEINAKIDELAKNKGVKLENCRCGKCRDTGKLENGEFCECYKLLVKKYKREESGLNILPDFRFRDHKTGLSDTLDKLYESMEKYADKFPLNNRKTLIFSGPVGVGKSCLIAAAANAVSVKGYDVMYIGAMDLQKVLLEYHTANVAEKSEIFAPLIAADLLIIDDLGVEPVYDRITIPYLYQILEGRAKKHTFITTNFTLSDINAKYGERISSRLSDVNNSQFIKMSGKDLRKISR